MAAGGLEATAQENLATEPSVATTGTGCNTNSETPAGNDPPSAGGHVSKRGNVHFYAAAPLKRHV